MVEDGVRRTEFGLIRRCSSPFAEETRRWRWKGIFLMPHETELLCVKLAAYSLLDMQVT